MTPLTSYTTITINLIRKRFWRNFFGSLEIQHVTTPRTDVSVLVRMPWPKIYRWRLFVTRIDRRPYASVQGNRSIFHSALTFELPSVHELPNAMRFWVGAAHYAISCGRCISRCHLPSLTPVVSIVCLHTWAARWRQVPGRSAHWPVVPNIAHYWLTHVLAENFLLYGMVGHYFQRLPLIHSDISSYFFLEERLFWYKRAAKQGLLPSRTTLTNWLISQPSLCYYQLSQSYVLFCIHNMPAELLHNTHTFVIFSLIYKKRNCCYDICPILVLSNTLVDDTALSTFSCSSAQKYH